MCCISKACAQHAHSSRFRDAKYYRPELADGKYRIEGAVVRRKVLVARHHLDNL